ncbi:Hypothetical protein LUCI_5172 [Lucifera butyrica]|uniref:DUF3231 family protein n=1 Tax=Lucifera butyrica TaxID=1351585 RepID=A0A498REE7_9FIRM|nr:DUF3231 family protein [Lucifera butyrica]VBB09874.1 Hypothetical protein LUCI_5172 [Lucifera butyrica]
MEQTELTAAESGSLWNNYLNTNIAVCMMHHFLLHIDDVEIRSVVEAAYQLGENLVTAVGKLLTADKIPLPTGYSVHQDVNTRAPRLYLDSFYLAYIKNMTRIGLSGYSSAFAAASRSNVRNFYHDCIKASALLDEKITAVQLAKGLTVCTPHLPTARIGETVQSMDFLGSLFGKQRPLLATEIDTLFLNFQTNSVGKALLMGFSQTAATDGVRSLAVRGTEIAHKHIQLFAKLLTSEDLPAPLRQEAAVTDNTIPPYSDRLMLHHLLLLIAYGLGNYGLALAFSMRADLVTLYTRLGLEVSQYLEDGMYRFIKNNWLEWPPHAIDHKALAEHEIRL